MAKLPKYLQGVVGAVKSGAGTAATLVDDNKDFLTEAARTQGKMRSDKRVAERAADDNRIYGAHQQELATLPSASAPPTAWEQNMAADTAAKQAAAANSAALEGMVKRTGPLPGVKYSNTINDQPMTPEEMQAKGMTQQEIAAAMYAQDNPNARGVIPGGERPNPAPVGLAPPAQSTVPQFKDGGLIGAGGQPVPMSTPDKGGLMPPGGKGPQPTMSAQELEQQVQQVVQQHPEAVQKVQAAISQAMQSGELTSQELNMAIQLAKAAALNPTMYPKIRQFAIAQGIATEADLPQEPDQGLIFTLLAASRAAQTQGQPTGGVPQSAMQAPVATMKDGGALPERSHNMDGSIPIAAHEGEFVIPAHVVKAKGTDFFNKMIGKGDV